MPHAVWKGHLAFGLVQIPVNLFAAEKRKELSFDLLDKRDMARIGYSKVNKSTGEEVAQQNIVKGFELQSGKHVVVSESDFKRATIESTHTVDISEFVLASEIDPIYFDRPYYLAPGRGGDRPYRLLHEALRASGRIGIGHVVLRTREAVAAVYPHERALVLNTLRYAHELRPLSELDLPAATKPSAKELAMARRLIDDMSGAWKPTQYKDRYRDVLLALIRRKGKGEKVLPEPEEEKEPEEGGKVLDLAALLKKSLGSPRTARRRSA